MMQLAEHRGFVAQLFLATRASNQVFFDRTEIGVGNIGSQVDVSETTTPQNALNTVPSVEYGT
ncbi:hypothetical protein KSC_034400 [Ktedonobacter sp. SOSP1-52]|nr:hypothetical protein KSC_034400 [Ktedonobacter sp. SOSP1-52]